MCKTFAVYRDGWSNDVRRFGDVLEATLAKFAEVHGALPKSIVVNPTVILDAQEVIQDFGFPIEVKPVGGCLLGEIWLSLSDSEGVQ